MSTRFLSFNFNIIGIILYNPKNLWYAEENKGGARMSVLFGDKIRDARKRAGMTQRQLAGDLGVGHTTVSNWEKNLSRPDADMIHKLCGLLRLQPNDFYGNPEQEPSLGGRTAVSDEDIKFALFGGDGEITDAMYDEVKRFAAFLKERQADQKE